MKPFPLTIIYNTLYLISTDPYTLSLNPKTFYKQTLFERKTIIYAFSGLRLLPKILPQHLEHQRKSESES